MNKSIILLVAILLAFLPIAHSIKVFTIEETEKISLQTKAEDPDANSYNSLITTYSAPLNDKGEWQTTYGDAGRHKATITVSDGANQASEEVIIVVRKKEDPPKIESFLPSQADLSINEGDSIDFRVLASDANKDSISYAWLVDDKPVKGGVKDGMEGREFSYTADYNDAGKHRISAIASDGKLSSSNEWNVDVVNVDVEGLLEQINDTTINENEIARLQLPDFEKYEIAYSISEPLGDKNEWKTGYNDSGSYEILVHADGKGFSGDKIVKVIVNDADRPLVFYKIGNKEISENEKLKIELDADDPDGDEIAYSAEILPEGARLEGNIFSWTPDFDTVKKERRIDRILGTFMKVKRKVNVQFTASSKGVKAVQEISITVKDTNRAPILEELKPLIINEGETLKIVPKAYDLDGDKLSLGYSGFMGSDTFKSGFDDAGEYQVNITATDGLLEDSKLLNIEIKQTNRAPVFSKVGDVKTKISNVGNVKTKEGEPITIMLNAADPDGDMITYSIDAPPEGSSLNGSVFSWTPGFDTAKKGETKNVALTFVASDGKAEARKAVVLEVRDKNRAPKIIDATGSGLTKINKLTTMSVKAVDEDGDKLSYTWSFGAFEKFQATSTHQRVFTSRGLKTVKVTVSDGTDEAEQIINVKVV